MVFCSWISTLVSRVSSTAEPAKVIGPPGTTVTGNAEVGGSMAAGALIATVGATALALTIQDRFELSSEDCPAVSIP